MTGQGTSKATTIDEAVAILRAGGVVAFPTETVYGLGADARRPEAVVQIFERKGRPRFDPLIVHVDRPEAARSWASEWPPAAERLAARFWPGPLTLVVPKVPKIDDLVTAGRPTVGLRVPAHPVALALLTAFAGPVAAPSANRFGRVSPTRADHVLDQLPDVPVVDGGPSSVGLESTIIGFDERGPLLLRPGGLPLEVLETEVGPIAIPADADPSASPGRAAQHYATTIPLYLDGVDEPPTGAVGHLAFQRADPRFPVAEVLSAKGDLTEAGARLFAALRRLDAAPIDAIWADRVPEEGLGRAIMDRLRRARAGRGPVDSA